MTDQEYMTLAVEKASQSEEPLKCGVIITKNNQIIAQANNSQRKDTDATAHAEIKAIREAGGILGDKDLEDCTAYCSCEPCTMCLSAFIFAKIKKVYFKTPVTEVSTTHIQISSADLISKAPRPIQLIQL